MFNRLHPLNLARKDVIPPSGQGSFEPKRKVEMSSNGDLHPSRLYSRTFPTANKALSKVSFQHHDGRGLNPFTMTETHPPTLNNPPQGLQPQPNAQQHIQLVAVPPTKTYPDCNVHQRGAHDQLPGHQQQAHGVIDSLHGVKIPEPQQAQGSSSEASPREASTPTGRSQRPSTGNGGVPPHTQRHESLDESEYASPTSSRGPAPQGSKESTPRLPKNSKDGKNGGNTAEGGEGKEKFHPWSDLKTKAGKERKRLPLACIACRRKKIRCSGEKPACKHCLRSRIPCVYKVTQRKAAPRTDYMAMLDKRLKRMEERVIKIIPKDDSTKISVIGRAVVKPAPLSQASRSHGSKKRAASEAFGAEVEEWTKPDKGNPSSSLLQANPKTGSGETKASLETDGAEYLPSEEIQEHLAEVFFEYLYGQSYHLLHKPSFMKKLKAGKVPPVLVLGVCAISARFSTHPQLATEPAFLRGEEWARPAREIVLRRYDEPNMNILCVYIMLGLHEFGTCQGGRSWMLGGMALRMAYALQLHRELDHDPLGRKRDKSSEFSFTDREIRRRTMWACFLMDRFNSSGTERPYFGNEENIKVQLPVKEARFQMGIPGPTESLDGSVPHPTSPDAGQIADPKENMGVAAYLIRIIAIWGRVNAYLNLGGKQDDQHGISHPESQWAILKAQAEHFYNNLPPSLKYSKENLANHAAEKLANHFIYLHVSFNQVLLFLHKFAIPANPGAQIPPNLPEDFVNEALKIAVEKAGVISMLLNEALDYQVAAPFVGYCAFVSSTVHIWGIFSKTPDIESSSKDNLAHNWKFISKMKKYWGMFHFMLENVKTLYRQYHDASLKGMSTGQSNKQDGQIFQYGDWFDKYPHGVSDLDYQDPAVEVKKESGNLLGEKSDLQSVEEFFTTVSPKTNADQRPRKASAKRAHRGSISQDQSQAQSTNHGGPKIKTENAAHMIPHSQPVHSQMQPPQLVHHPPMVIPHQSPQQSHPHHPSQQQQMSTLQSPHPSSANFSPQQDMYTPSHPTFPYAAFPSAITQPQQYIPAHAKPFMDLDRQMVFASCANTDPTAAMSNEQFLASMNNGCAVHPSLSGLWDNSTQMGFSAELQQRTSGFGAETGSAWFMPFNMQPPSGSIQDSEMANWPDMATLGPDVDGDAGGAEQAQGEPMGGVSGLVE